jgi:hypothetical protein
MKNIKELRERYQKHVDIVNDELKKTKKCVIEGKEVDWLCRKLWWYEQMMKSERKGDIANFPYLGFVASALVEGMLSLKCKNLVPCGNCKGSGYVRG